MEVGVFFDWNESTAYWDSIPEQNIHTFHTYTATKPIFTINLQSSMPIYYDSTSEKLRFH